MTAYSDGVYQTEIELDKVHGSLNVCGPEARTCVEAVVRFVEFRGADVLQPSGVEVHAAAGCAEGARPQHDIHEEQAFTTTCLTVHLREMRAMKVPTKRGNPNPRAPVEEGQHVHAGRIDVLTEASARMQSR